MGFFRDKKLWILSLLKNRAQHNKIKTDIADLQNIISQHQIYIDENKLLKMHIESLEKASNDNSQLLQEKVRDLTAQIQNLKKDNLENLYSLRKLTPQAKLEFIEVHLVEHCNLNCFGCNHFSQLAQEEYTDINIFEQDMQRLSTITGGGVNRFHLMGGEPLLHPNCIEFFKITRKYFPKSSIWLVTNGILLEQQDERFWQSCRNEKIEIRPTKYPIKINWEIIESKCKQYDIPLIFYDNSNMQKTSYQFLLDRNGSQDAFYSFTHCHQANWCVRLHKGKLCTCTVAVSIEHFNKKFNTDFPMESNNFLDIYKIDNYGEILRFLAQPIPFCKYCKMSDWKSIGKWKTSKKDQSEYLQKYTE